MKIMISQPMKGLSEETIRKNREKVVNYIEYLGHTVVDSIFTDKPIETANQGLWYLGKSFQLISEVDAVFFMSNWQDTRGCWMEYEACIRYKITTYTDLSDVPDERRK